MSVKIPRHLLEKAIRQALREQEAAAAPPELSNEEKFKKQLAQLNASREGDTITGQDKKFVKRGGDWYLADVQQSEESLLSLVKDEFVEDLQKKIKRGATSITIKGNQFIGGGTQKSATFTKLGTGVWEDQSPVPPQIVAQYIVLPTEAPEFEADVSGVGGEKQWVYKQDELMIVLTNQSLLVMATSGNQDDPLGATYNVLEKTGILSNFMDVGNARKGFLGVGGPVGNYEKFARSRESLLKFLRTGDQPGEFYNVPLANLNMGDMTTAIGKARTLGAKIFDLFTADNIKMNFTMTKFGPALERSLVMGGRKGEGGSGGISDKDVRALIETGLFREEALPNAGGGRYSVNLDPNTQKYVMLSDEESEETKGALEVTQVGDVTFTPLISYVPKIESYTSTQVDTYADAFLLYTAGIVTRQAVEQQPEVVAPPPPPPAAAAPPPEAVSDVKVPDEGTPVGDPAGAVFFKFNRDEFEDSEKADEYIRSVIEDLKRVGPDKITQKYQNEAYTVIATASTEGVDAYNLALSRKRSDKVSARFRELCEEGGDTGRGAVSALRSAERPVGEAPYKGMKDLPKNEQSTYQRFVKFYWGPVSDAEAPGLAKEFADTVGGRSSLEENESRQMQEIRRHIRKILLEAMR